MDLFGGGALARATPRGTVARDVALGASEGGFVAVTIEVAAVTSVAEARAETMIDRPADEVWAIVGDFSNVDWIPGVDGCRFVEDTDRVVSMTGMEFTDVCCAATTPVGR